MKERYQLAIWDTFFGTPRYFVQDDGNGLSLWKKQEIDPITQKRINEAHPVVETELQE